MRRSSAGIGVLLATGLTALMACGGDRLAVGSRPVTISYCCDEWLMSPLWGMPIMHAVFLPLTVIGPEGAPRPRLASRWEHSPDHREWTVWLRQDLEWHDGTPVTAADVVFTLELLARPDVAFYAPESYQVELLDEYSYRIRYRHFGPGNPWDWYTVYYPRHLLGSLDPADLASWPFWTEPVGNGPFRYRRHLPGVMMELEASESFALEGPRVPGVVVRFNHGTPTATELLSGEVDIAPQVSRMDALMLREDERFSVYLTPATNRAVGIDWNCAREPFADARVRRALTLAIDRREVLRAFDLPADVPIFDVVFTARQFVRGEIPEPLESDVEEAKRLLLKAGWSDTDADSIVDRKGEPFRFTALVPQIGDAPDRAVLVQAQLRRVGVQMEIRLQGGDAVFRARRAGEFDAVFADHQVSSPTENAPMAQVLGLGEDPGLGYRRPEVASLFAALRQTVDADEVDRLYSEMWPLLEEDLPITFLHSTVWWSVARREIRGIDPRVVDPAMILDRIWLEDNRE